MLVSASVASAGVTVENVNFYSPDQVCDKGVTVIEEDALEYDKDAKVFTLSMGPSLKRTLLVAFEITREDEPTKVVVEWTTPKNSWCQASTYDAYVEQKPTETSTVNWHTKACRTIYVVPDKNADCLGEWTVRLLDPSGNVLTTSEGNECKYTVVITQ